MKFCCGVTLYYPSKEELESIRKYREIFDCVFLFDNTDNEDRIKHKQLFSPDDGYIYISNHKNEGLSVAFNMMCRAAISHGFDYICLFDQDSLIYNKDLIKIIDYINKDITKNVGIYVPEVIYLHKNKSILSNNVDEVKGFEIEWAISSGSFINLFVYQKTEGFDVNYFIDRLDYDYCILIRRQGFKVIRIKNTFLHQKLGEQGIGMFKRVSQHGPLRHYYMFRNRFYFYLKRDNPSMNDKIKVGLLSLKHILIIFLLEKEKVEKFKMLIRGGKDFAKNKMGKYH